MFPAPSSPFDLQPAGDPDALGRAAVGLVHGSGQLELAATATTAMRIAAVGRTAGAIDARIDELYGSLQDAGKQLAVVGATMRIYSDDLRGFHHDYLVLSDQRDEAHRRVDAAERDVREYVNQLPGGPVAALTLSPAGTDPELARLRALLDVAEDELANANRLLRLACEHFDERARAAAASIDALLPEGPGLLDSLGDAACALAGAVMDAVRDLGDVLGDVLHDIAGALADFAAKATTVLLVVAAVVVVAGILAIALVDPLLAVIVAAAIVTLMALPAVIVGLVASQVGLPQQVQIDLVLATIIATNPIIGGFIVSHLAQEVLGEDLEVEPADPTELDAGASEALARLESADLETPADLIAVAGLVDKIGGGDAAYIDIATVTAGGEVTYVVTAPSTQDWNLPFDTPAPNDLGACLALMALPELESRYERAVFEAMTEAGIPEGANIVFNGWSLGGMVSAEAARDLENNPDALWHPVAVVAAGSPIDLVAQDLEAPVIQAKNIADVVHALELMRFGLEGPGDATGWDVSLHDFNPEIAVLGHNNNAYVQTAADNAAELNPVLAAVMPQAGPGEEPVITHQLFKVTE